MKHETPYYDLWQAEKARREELEEELRQLRETRSLGEEMLPVNLTPAYRQIMSKLLAAPPSMVVTHDSLLGALNDSPRAWASGSEGVRLVHVQVCKMRRRLAPIGVEIETVWGRGYRLPKTSRDAWQAAIDRMNAETEKVA